MKFLAYGWSSQRSLPAVRDQVVAALTQARHTGWDGLLEGQRAYLDDFWGSADVELDGDTELQQAIRFALFHTLQSGARAEQRAIAAKVPMGPATTVTRSGTPSARSPGAHLYVALTPPATRSGGGMPRSTSPASARASSAWKAPPSRRTIRGQECSGYWPAGTAPSTSARTSPMRSSDTNMQRKMRTSEREAGSSFLVQTARLWRSLGHHDAHGRFRIDGVTTRRVRRNRRQQRHTNSLAQRNLRAAAAAVARHPRRAAELGAGLEEAAAWRDAAENMVVPWDDALGVHPQSEGFTDHQVWDFANTTPEQYPLLLHFPYFDLYRKQVVKQADLVLALHWRGDAFTDEEKARDFAYYEAMTVRDSSPRPARRPIAAEVGHLELAYDYSARRRSWTCTTWRTTPATGFTSPHWQGLDRRSRRLRGMRDHEGDITFAPASGTAPALAFRLLSVEPAQGRSHEDARRLHPPRRRTGRGRPSRQDDHGLAERDRDRRDPARGRAPHPRPASRPRPARRGEG